MWSLVGSMVVAQYRFAGDIEPRELMKCAVMQASRQWLLNDWATRPLGTCMYALGFKRAGLLEQEPNPAKWQDGGISF
jgi:hypothetical protein